VFLEQARSLQPLQHRHHQKLAGAERTIEPIGIAKVSGKFAQPYGAALGCSLTC
jgi:hypothetical protein